MVCLWQLRLHDPTLLVTASNTYLRHEYCSGSGLNKLQLDRLQERNISGTSKHNDYNLRELQYANLRGRSVRDGTSQLM